VRGVSEQISASHSLLFAEICFESSPGSRKIVNRKVYLTNIRLDIKQKESRNKYFLDFCLAKDLLRVLTGQ